MSTATAGPYENTSAYADREFFDTTGTQPGFCEDCEHAPCVAGGKGFCTARPRFIVTGAMCREVLALVDEQFHNPLYPVLREAVTAVAAAARRGGFPAEGNGWLLEHTSVEALEDLAGIRAGLRRLAS